MARLHTAGRRLGPFGGALQTPSQKIDIKAGLVDCVFRFASSDLADARLPCADALFLQHPAGIYNIHVRGEAMPLNQYLTIIKPAMFVRNGRF